VKKRSVALFNLLFLFGIFLVHLYTLNLILENVSWVSKGQIVTSMTYPTLNFLLKGSGGGTASAVYLLDVSFLAFIFGFLANSLLLVKEWKDANAQ